MTFGYLLGQETDEDHESSFYLISGCNNILQGSSPPARTRIEHCCLVAPGNNWDITVKCRRPLLSHSKGGSQQNHSWRNVKEVYPDSKVEQKHNDIEVTFPPLREDIEVAAFGRPGRNDQKRMQMAIFGRKPTQGRDWKIWVYLVDDTDTACKVPCALNVPILFDPTVIKVLQVFYALLTDCLEYTKTRWFESRCRLQGTLF